MIALHSFISRVLQVVESNAVNQNNKIPVYVKKRVKPTLSPHKQQLFENYKHWNEIVFTIFSNGYSFKDQAILNMQGRKKYKLVICLSEVSCWIYWA